MKKSMMSVLCAHSKEEASLRSICDEHELDYDLALVYVEERYPYRFQRRHEGEELFITYRPVGRGDGRPLFELTHVAQPACHSCEAEQSPGVLGQDMETLFLCHCGAWTKIRALPNGYSCLEYKPLPIPASLKQVVQQPQLVEARVVEKRVKSAVKRQMPITLDIWN